MEHYHSDSGDRDLPSELPIPHQGETVPPPHVLQYARERGARLIVRTFASGRHPGAWYVKGNRNTDYVQVKTSIQYNVNHHRHRRRQCWLLPPYEISNKIIWVGG